MTSEVKCDLGIEICRLNHLCCHCSGVSKGFCELIETQEIPRVVAERALDKLGSHKAKPAGKIWTLRCFLTNKRGWADLLFHIENMGRPHTSTSEEEKGC